jgi:hypothetical protein
MCIWLDSLDGRPGVLPETRILNDAAVLVLFQISWGPGPATRGRLALRFDQNGNIYAALQREAIPYGAPEDHVQ